MHGRMAGLLGLSREGAWTRTRERKPEDQTQGRGDPRGRPVPYLSEGKTKHESYG